MSVTVYLVNHDKVSARWQLTENQNHKNDSLPQNSHPGYYTLGTVGSASFSAVLL